MGFDQGVVSPCRTTKPGRFWLCLVNRSTHTRLFLKHRRRRRARTRKLDLDRGCPPAVVEGALGGGAVRGRGAFFFPHNTYERPVLEVDFELRASYYAPRTRDSGLDSGLGLRRRDYG